MYEEPLVSVVTPVYNGEDYLAECIESVLKQTYKNFEYIIVNNCSKDRSLEIAQAYANKDSRLRVQSNTKFVEVIENHNIAFRLISRQAKYCKVVCADDFIFPDCLTRLVEFAEANPSVGVVGSYQLSGSTVRWQGFEYPKAVFSGLEICRRNLLGTDKAFGFGTPTSLLYRADLVRESEAFFPNPSPHADTSACLKSLRNSSFGFVYQVLSYERTHEESQSYKSAQINLHASARLNDLVQYGPYYLSKEELEREVNRELSHYYRFLAVNFIFVRRDAQFWNYHERRLTDLGYPPRRSLLLKALMVKVLQEVVNPEQAIRKVWRRVFPKSSDANFRASRLE
jgi:glycosyltransferase involved in cell wall biosynthesis